MTNTNIGQTFRSNTERNVVGTVSKVTDLFVTLQVGAYSISMSHRTFATSYSPAN